MNTDLMFSSKSDNWETPQNLFNELNQEFHFTLDVCATHSTAKCVRYFTPQDDGLMQPWTGVCWMNPPYSRPEQKCKPNCKKATCKQRGYHMPEYKPGQEDWIKKAYAESQKGTTVVCLLPARTDTACWHDYCMKGEIRFIRGRLIFEGANASAPFPSAIVIFRQPEGVSA